MKVLAVICYVVALLLGIGGFINASKPSASPIVSVIGSFIVPGLFAWWGVILWKKVNKNT
jgi:hypothetical protein